MESGSAMFENRDEFNSWRDKQMVYENPYYQLIVTNIQGEKLNRWYTALKLHELDYELDELEVWEGYLPNEIRK